MVASPALPPVASPLAEIANTPASDERHVTVDVRSRVVPSEI
jgi:hypothetical protein